MGVGELFTVGLVGVLALGSGSCFSGNDTVAGRGLGS